MFLRNHFIGEGAFEMPKIKKEEVDLENIELVGYDKLSSSKDNQIVHFFLDDYKFEVMWNDPLPRAQRLKSHKAVLAPNFSVYTEMPKPHKHSNPHDHDVDWSNNFPDFGPPINYDDAASEFKRYGVLTMSRKGYIEFSKYVSIEDFRNSLLYGKEIVFSYNNKEYGVFCEGKSLFTFNEANKPETEIEFSNIDELLGTDVQGKSLCEIITEVEVLHRNV